MKITVASDHAGYELKKIIEEHLTSLGHEVIDGGAQTSDEPFSYVVAGQKVCDDILSSGADRGIAICGTGIGISVVCNKHKGITCGVCTNEYMARMSRRHNDANVLAIGARVVGKALALSMVDVFLEEEFAGERHGERVNDLKAQEDRLFK